MWPWSRALLWAPRSCPPAEPQPGWDAWHRACSQPLLPLTHQVVSTCHKPSQTSCLAPGLPLLVPEKERKGFRFYCVHKSLLTGRFLDPRCFFTYEVTFIRKMKISKQFAVVVSQLGLQSNDVIQIF